MPSHRDPNSLVTFMDRSEPHAQERDARVVGRPRPRCRGQKRGRKSLAYCLVLG